MNEMVKNTGLFALVALLIVITGVMQSWNTALLILNMGLISAIMALGVNLQWGFAGLFNVGVDAPDPRRMGCGRFRRDCGPCDGGRDDRAGRAGL